MGNLVWHEYARYVALTAAVYALWSAYFGIFYRKYIFDFVNGILRAPGGVQPAASDSIFIAVIVKAPIVQILNMVLSLVYITLDYPAAFLKNTALHRSFPIRIVLLFLMTFLSILYYQGTNAAIYSFIAALCYARAQLKGEVMPEAKDNKGRRGRA
uniref:Phosphogluconate dehydratase (EC) n=1 Tax=Ganoderma boninense TaxID=34458 RepID=A0A5K1K5C2_9APHY|nr:Phosphogluconate dehydratase (EC [Ganoderma boninense]